ncbi:unnamed protein product, partial [Polarella glacialis]
IARCQPTFGATRVVAWSASVLGAAHDACLTLFPEVPPGAIVAALASSGFAEGAANGVVTSPPKPPWQTD